MAFGAVSLQRLSVQWRGMHTSAADRDTKIGHSKIDLSLKSNMHLLYIASIIQFAPKIYGIWKGFRVNDTYESEIDGPTVRIAWCEPASQLSLPPRQTQSQTKMIINNILFHFIVDIIYFIVCSASGYGYWLYPWLAYVLCGKRLLFRNLWHIQNEQKKNEKIKKKNSINFVTCDALSKFIPPKISFAFNGDASQFLFSEWIAPLYKYQ